MKVIHYKPSALHHDTWSQSSQEHYVLWFWWSWNCSSDKKKLNTFSPQTGKGHRKTQLHMCYGNPEWEVQWNWKKLFLHIFLMSSYNQTNPLSNTLLSQSHFTKVWFSILIMQIVLWPCDANTSQHTTGQLKHATLIYLEMNIQLHVELLRCIWLQSPSTTSTWSEMYFPNT